MNGYMIFHVAHSPTDHLLFFKNFSRRITCSNLICGNHPVHSFSATQRWMVIWCSTSHIVQQTILITIPAPVDRQHLFWKTALFLVPWTKLSVLSKMIHLCSTELLHLTAVEKASSSSPIELSSMLAMIHVSMNMNARERQVHAKIFTTDLACYTVTLNVLVNKHEISRIYEALLCSMRCFSWRSIL